MTVDDLRRAIRDLPGQLKIDCYNSADQNEFSAHVLIHSKWNSRLVFASDDSEVAVREIILYQDETAADSEFGVGA